MKQAMKSTAGRRGRTATMWVTLAAGMLASACACNDPYIGGPGDDEAVDQIGAWERTPPSFSSTYCVRPPGATYGAGDGSSWDNAFSGLPEQLERGARYFVAAGDYYTGPSEDRYEHRVFEDAEAGEEFIGIYKATGADHGVETGWETALGEGPASFGPVSFITGRYILDGQVGERDSGQGIVIKTRDCPARAELPVSSPITFPWNSETQYLAVRHVEVADCGNHDDPTTRSQDAVYGINPVAHLVFRNCYIHDAWRGLFFLWQAYDVLVEDCAFARAGLQHESFTIALRDVRNVIIRRNVMLDSYNNFIGLQTVRNVAISSNVFARSMEDWDIWAAIFSQEPAKNVQIMGNTFYNLTGLNTGIRFENDHDNIQVVNNLWAANRTNQIMLSGSHDHNAFFDNLRVSGEVPVDLSDRIEDAEAQFIDSDPFVDAASYDLRLAVPTEPGLSLEPPFDVDCSGSTRGGDGVWDRGAYEYTQ